MGTLLVLLPLLPIVGQSFTHSPPCLFSSCKSSTGNSRCLLASPRRQRRIIFTSSSPLHESATSRSESSASSSTNPDKYGAAPPGSAASAFPELQNRGKVNEIDFCMAPSDVSLSRSYASAAVAATAATAATPSRSAGGGDEANIFGDAGDGESSAAADEGLATAVRPAAGGGSTTRLLSLTRALNNVSNRAVRRVLLSRSWPSAEALNLSLRQVLASREEAAARGGADAGEEAVRSSSAKCPVPRPILNILMRRRGGDVSGGGSRQEVDAAASAAAPGKRTDEEWIDDQIAQFKRNYGALPGYDMAEAYLECILSLATSGVESPKVSEVYAAGVYDEPYKRLISVLKSVGAEFIDVTERESGTDPPLRKIAPKLLDKDICLSMLDTITIQKDKREAADKELVRKEDGNEEEDVGAESQIEAAEGGGEIASAIDEEALDVADGETEPEKGKKFRLQFWRGGEKRNAEQRKGGSDSSSNGSELSQTTLTSESSEADEESITREDLGGVLLSSEEPSMTRQLNVLSNIVQRAMLFGGDQELLVLFETLEADKPAFIQRWYRDGEAFTDSYPVPEEEQRPGVQYLNCLLQLLKDGFTKGVITDLDPPFPLSQSYSNAYERLTASLVELGSGYVKPMVAKKAPLPKTAKEELGRFAQWEVQFRKSGPKEISPYPDDLVGEWMVKDEVQGKTIGVSNVTFVPQGVVQVAPPMQGLRWRLDPGPTHLDTCTFQVLGDDGAILQYRGFVDRGARLEARFSKRAIKIRGAVTFQMRDGESVYMGDDYRKDMLPIDYKTGTTRFVMTKV